MNPNALALSATLRRLEARHADQPLMQRAGEAAAQWAGELAGDWQASILILAGPGNNGGDAFEAARLLRERFFDVHVVFAGDPAGLPADAAAAFQRFQAAGGACVAEIPEGPRWALIIDGLFGIGLTRAPAGPYACWISDANRLAERDHCPLLTLDCPSGLNADTGTAFSPCIQASQTLTFIADKPGLHTNDGPDQCGEIRVADLGLADATTDGQLIALNDFAAQLKPRRRNAHKGTFGNAGILGGSPSMVGAAFLAARAAIKLGAGRVYLGLLDADAPTIDLAQPEIMLRRADTLGQVDLQALACGPGLSQSAAARKMLELALGAPAQLVLDADALNLLAGDKPLANLLSNRAAPTILTPHPAEAARLLVCTVADIQGNRIAAAGELASRYRSHVALKGCGTVIASPNGRWWINPTGNPGMATAGMGDVLCGLIAALLAQHWPAEAAVLAAVYLHGAAADCCVAQGIGPVGLTAGETIDPARQLFNTWLSDAR